MCMTLASRSGLFIDAHMSMNQLGMDSRSLTCHRASRRQLAHWSQSVEDITATSPPLTLHVSKMLTETSTTPNSTIGMRLRENKVARDIGRLRERIMSKWSDEQLKATMVAVDIWTNTMKTSYKFQIPYSTLHEWCCGMRISWKHPPAPPNCSKSTRKTTYSGLFGEHMWLRILFNAHCIKT